MSTRLSIELECTVEIKMDLLCGADAFGYKDFLCRYYCPYLNEMG